MPAKYGIRATYDAESITVYQAYSPEIAEAAVKAQRFVPPFSLGRMTWIKPSFLWLMERSNWARKSGQERILAVRITRAGWEEGLAQAVLTHPEKGAYRDADEWRRLSKEAAVLVQWDPERSLSGASLEHRAIQVGLSATSSSATSMNGPSPSPTSRPSSVSFTPSGSPAGPRTPRANYQKNASTRYRRKSPFASESPPYRANGSAKQAPLSIQHNPPALRRKMAGRESRG
jgi:hypothetical protein